jgi:hypothetical protein
MNDLEDRLRTALAARAADFTASPDAWERTTARARRPLRMFTFGIPGRRGLSRFTPLAAAAAVVAVAITTAALASTGGWHDLVSGRPATAVRHQTAPLRPRPRLGTPGALTTRLPCGGPDVRKSAAFTGQSTTTWFTWVPTQNAYYMCDLRYSNGHYLAGDWGGGVAPTGSAVASANLWDGGEAGLVAKSATSVTADLANGRHIVGTVRLSPGFPLAEWWVDHSPYPWDVSVVFVFRDAAGHVVTRLSRAFATPVNPLAHPTPLTPAAVRCSFEGGESQLVRVPQTVDGFPTWTYIQFGRDWDNHPSLCENAGLLNGSTGFSTSFRAYPALTVEQPAVAEEDLLETDTISGFAASWVTSVTAVLADGRKYPGIFVDGRGFPYRVWLVRFPAKATATLVFRDAGGQVVATEHGANGNWPVSG